MAFGPIIVCGDYKGDLQGIVNVLNQWEFDNGGDIKFAVERDIIFSTCIGDGPHSEPRRPKEHPSEETEWISDATISRNISPLLKSGTLELVSVDHEDDRNAYFVKVIIHANGLVKHDSQFLQQAE
jgi:hypothetical protein